MQHPRILLLRHTRPDIARGLCYGRLEVGLAPSYPDERRALASSIPAHSRLFSSPSLRCRTLAEDLASGPVCLSEEIMELDFGLWEGKLWNDIPRHESEPWTDDFIRAAPPGGESFAQLTRRTLRFMASLPLDQDLVIVTHSGVIRALRMWDQDRPLQEAFAEDLSFGGIYELTRHAREAGAFAIPFERWGRASTIVPPGASR